MKMLYLIKNPKVNSTSIFDKYNKESNNMDKR